MEKGIGEFVITGEDIMLDPDKMSSLTDSFVNLFRNAVDHGIETPEVQISKNKYEFGCIRCNFMIMDQNIHIEISDDGKGINLEQMACFKNSKFLKHAEFYLD